MKVFFYGLFMDEELLRSKGIQPSGIRLGFVDDYELCIGERATLLRRPNGRAYGAMMKIAPAQAKALNAEDSDADYLPETLTVDLLDGTQIAATCYNLPAEKVSGTNRQYATSLLAVATRLCFPEPYLAHIRQAGNL
jgi:hypothetical protein